MQKILAFLLLAIIASAQVNDWKTCADSIIKLETDIVNFGVFIQNAVEGTFIPDVKKIITECKFKGAEPNDWATCATAIFAMGNDVVDFGRKIEDEVKGTLIPDVVKIGEVCKKEQVEQQISDWPTCLEDVSKIVELAAKITDDIKKFNFVQLVKDVQELYNTVQKAIKDCTKTTLKMQEMPQDWPTCLEDISKIVELASKVAEDIKKFNFVQLVKDVQELYNTVQKAIKDCTKGDKLEASLEFDNDWPTCLEDISKIVELASKVADDVKKFNFVQLVKDIQELYNTVQKAITDCTKQQNLELSPSDWPTCLEDISKIVEIASKVAEDIKKFNFVQLVKDIQELYNTVQKAITDCTKRVFDYYPADSDWPTCLEDISKIVELASKVAEDIKKFNFVQLVKDVQELYNTVQKAIKDCTKQEKLEFAPSDWPTCLEDISKIVELAQKIAQDISKFNFVQLVKDVQELYNTVQKALKDCTK